MPSCFEKFPVERGEPAKELTIAPVEPPGMERLMAIAAKYDIDIPRDATQRQVRRPLTSCPYSPEYVEGEFSEVRRSSLRPHSSGPLAPDQPKT